MNYLTSDIIKTKHGFFTKNGGVSIDGYHSLNCSFGVGDGVDNVDYNQRCVASSLGFPRLKLATLEQVHGREVFVVNSSNIGVFDSHYNRPRADALVTSLEGVIIGILTADCAPVLFYDKKNQIIACAHAGWRGALNGVLDATISTMMNMGSLVTDICVAIGPCIKIQSYVTGQSMFDEFLSKDLSSEIFFQPLDSTNEKKWLFDLSGYVKNKLKNLEVSNIDMIDRDTFSDKNFFSFRRNKQDGLFPDCGRQISAITLGIK